jgi:hypothetical protein
MTTVIVLLVLAFVVGLLMLAGRRTRRHGGNLDRGEAGHDRSSYMGPG